MSKNTLTSFFLASATAFTLLLVPTISHADEVSANSPSTETTEVVTTPASTVSNVDDAISSVDLSSDNTEVTSSNGSVSNTEAKAKLMTLAASVTKIQGSVKSTTKVIYYPGTKTIEAEEVLTYVTITYSKSYSVTYTITSSYANTETRTYHYTTH